MPIETDLARSQYDTNGTTGPWTVGFYFLRNADLLVTYTDGDGVSTALALDVDYTVAGAGSQSGGTVTTMTAYASGGTITIDRNLEALQPEEFTDTDRFPAAALNRGLDRLTMLIQQLELVSSRSLRFPYPATVADASFTFDQLSSAVAAAYSASALADAVTYTPAGANAVSQSVQSLLRGDYVEADSYTTIQDALNTGKHVRVRGTGSWRVTSNLTFTADGQVLFGDGYLSMVQASTVLGNAISATGRTGCKVLNLRIKAIGTFGNYNTGAGIAFFSSTACEARGCWVENHRGAGVLVYDSNDCTVEANHFSASPAASATVDTQCFADIAVVYSSSRNKIGGNVCTSGQGTGILVQTVTNGDVADDNKIVGNTLAGHGVYGIAIYRNSQTLADVPLQSLRRTVIVGNTIDGVTGGVQNSITSTYTYGAGIYLQGSEDATVVGNSIRDTHSAAVTFAELLAPGAIGVTNLTRCTISGNVIDTAGMFGIDIGDGNNFGEANGGAAVLGNTISNATRGGIHNRRRGRIVITGNIIDGVGDSGIEVNNASLADDIVIGSNVLRNVSGVAGVEVKFGRGVVVAGNLVDTATNAGIFVADSVDVDLIGGKVRNQSGRGVQIASSCSDTTVRGVTVRGTGSSTEGFRFDSATVYSDLEVSGCTTDYAGAFGPGAVLTNNSATPAVGRGTVWTCSNSSATTITNFTGAARYQDLIVFFTNANTTLDFTGSSLTGNGGVDRLMPAGSMLRAVFDGTTWRCTLSLPS